MKIKNIILSSFVLFGIQSFAQTADTTIIVNGVCDMCKKNIEAACDLNGVESATWSPETKELTLTFNPDEISLEQINESVNKAGYDTEFTSATEEDYEGLHACCKYRDPEVHSAH